MLPEEKDHFVQNAVRLDGSPLRQMSATATVPKSSSYSNNEEDTTEYCRWHYMKNLEKRSRHGTNDGQTHDEMGNTLLDYSRCANHRSSYLCAFTCPCRLNYVKIRLIHGQRVGVHRRLGSNISFVLLAPDIMKQLT